MKEDDDDEWLDSGGDDDVPKGMSTWTRAVTKRAHVEYEGITSKRHGKPQRRLSNDLVELQKAEKDIRAANVGQQLSNDVSRRLLLAAVVMQLDYVERTQKEGANSSRKIASSRVRERVFVCLKLVPSRTAKSSTRTSMQTNKSSIIPIILHSRQGKGQHQQKSNTRSEHHKGLRRYARLRALQASPPQARHGPPSHRVSGREQVETEEDRNFKRKAFDSAFRCMQKYLAKLEYRRGKRSSNVVFKESIQLKRRCYLRELLGNRAIPAHEQLREVYLDESYIHQHYHRLDDSLWDSNDEQGVQVGKIADGEWRYYFMAAIQGHNQCFLANEEQNFEHNKAGLVTETYGRLCPSCKREQNGDYHKVFNGVNFLKWWNEKLAPNLPMPSPIVMDKAAYHRTLPLDTPSPAWIKKGGVH